MPRSTGAAGVGEAVWEKLQEQGRTQKKVKGMYGSTKHTPRRRNSREARRRAVCWHSCCSWKRFRVREKVWRHLMTWTRDENKGWLLARSKCLNFSCHSQKTERKLSILEMQQNLRFAFVSLCRTFPNLKPSAAIKLRIQGRRRRFSSWTDQQIAECNAEMSNDFAHVNQAQTYTASSSIPRDQKTRSWVDNEIEEANAEFASIFGAQGTVDTKHPQSKHSILLVCKSNTLKWVPWLECGGESTNSSEIPTLTHAEPGNICFLCRQIKRA